MGARGWVAGITSHGSVILPRGRLVTVETPGYPRHPPFIQHDAVVNQKYNKVYKPRGEGRVGYRGANEYILENCKTHLKLIKIIKPMTINIIKSS